MKPEALGYTTIEKLKEVEKPGKLANDLNGYKKSRLNHPVGAFLTHMIQGNVVCIYREDMKKPLPKKQ